MRTLRIWMLTIFAGVPLFVLADSPASNSSLDHCVFQFETEPGRERLPSDLKPPLNKPLVWRNDSPEVSKDGKNTDAILMLPDETPIGVHANYLADINGIGMMFTKYSKPQEVGQDSIFLQSLAGFTKDGYLHVTGKVNGYNVGFKCRDPEKSQF
jgi:hypothetical protein